MKKILLLSLLFVLLLIPSVSHAEEEQETKEPVNLYLFMGATCHYCEGFLDWLETVDDDVKSKFNLVKLSIVLYLLASILAFSLPTFFIPRANKRRSRELFLLSSIAFNKLVTDFSPYPSSFINSSFLSDSLYISGIVLINLKLYKSSINLSPNPSIFIAGRDTK